MAELSKFTKAIELFAMFKEGQYLHVGVLRRNIGLSNGDINEFVETLLKQGKVERVYKMRCHKCQWSSDFYDRLEDIPTVTDCECCDTEIVFQHNHETVYRVLTK